MYNNHTLSNYQSDVYSIDTLKDFIAGGRDKITRKLANNTYARIADDGVRIKLHDTDIVKFNNGGRTITLNTGGWQSVTTKERLNRYTKAGIYQKAGIWYMSDGSLFYDGVVIRIDGTVMNPKPTEKYEKQVKAIKKIARAYAKDYVQALKNGLIDYPSGGDCWACLMKGPKGQESFPGSNHIQDHIDEKYYVPSLLVNAGRAAGYRDEQIGLMGVGGRRLFIDPENVLYRYIVKQLKGAL